jgi:predicted HTH domain antitoxin
MQVILEIPDGIAHRLFEEGEDIPRRLLESLAVEGYLSGELTHAEVGELLGLSRLEVDAFLKSKGAFPKDDLDELKADEDALRQLGFR